ncbi:unnamed protein product [Lactuca saligna]|uniref:Uncharacterized protein n=1 Tax=Lactuca saligna TaxID=75948 RepID=A0AA35Z0T8_LACSI|nr:unnamed protein product [Lactuca saligna]
MKENPHSLRTKQTFSSSLTFKMILQLPCRYPTNIVYTLYLRITNELFRNCYLLVRRLHFKMKGQVLSNWRSCCNKKDLLNTPLVLVSILLFLVQLIQIFFNRGRCFSSVTFVMTDVTPYQCNLRPDGRQRDAD